MSTTKKPTTPKRIWICNCKSGVTTLGEYISARRRVFATIGRNDENFNEVVDLLVRCWRGSFSRLYTSYDLVGDPRPDLRAALLQRGIPLSP